MKRSDLIFLAVMIIPAIIMLLMIFFGLTYRVWFSFWWVLLVPVALAKSLFPKSKLTKWAEVKILQ